MMRVGYTEYWPTHRLGNRVGSTNQSCECAKLDHESCYSITSQEPVSIKAAQGHHLGIGKSLTTNKQQMIKTNKGWDQVPPLLK